MRKKELFGLNIKLGILGLIAFIILWEVIALFVVNNPLFLTPPHQVVISLHQLFAQGLIYEHLLASLEEFFLGIGLAVIFGVILGIFFGWYKKIHWFFSPLLTSFYAMPTIAIFPLILIWIGLGFWPKVTIVFLAAFFPILINTIAGVRNIDHDFIRLGKSFGGSDLKIITNIIFPATLPFIASGLRMAVIRGLSGMLVAEFYVSNKGIGYLITYFGNTFQTDKLFAMVIIIIFLGLALTLLVNFLEKRLQAWKPEKN
ncbi:MAG: ABC transporter permease [Patescibacteria group bacterium]|nr:ABC transporter permease [Patescibacteria group bacterium]